jgi:hypothetical protein
MTGKAPARSVNLARTSTFGPWQVRLSGGVGAMRTVGVGLLTSSAFDAVGWSATAEASILFARRFANSWAIAAGPLATYISQSFDVYHQSMFVPFVRRDVELMVFGGLRHEM